MKSWALSDPFISNKSLFSFWQLLALTFWAGSTLCSMKSLTCCRTARPLAVCRKRPSSVGPVVDLARNTSPVLNKPKGIIGSSSWMPNSNCCWLKLRQRVETICFSGLQEHWIPSMLWLLSDSLKLKLAHKVDTKLRAYDFHPLIYITCNQLYYSVGVIDKAQIKLSSQKQKRVSESFSASSIFYK